MIPSGAKEAVSGDLQPCSFTATQQSQPHAKGRVERSAASAASPLNIQPLNYTDGASWKELGPTKFSVMIPKHLTPLGFLFVLFCFLKRQSENKAALSRVGRGARTTPFKLKTEKSQAKGR